MIVAIDGPAGAGKSSVAKEVAKRLGLTYIDTGAMYRALTWKALINKVDINDEADLEKLLLASDIELIPSPEENVLKVYIDGNDVTGEIREPSISSSVSLVSSHRSIRKIMVDKQRIIANTRKGVVMDGRDIGTVVFPNADIKIFLIASIEERANRRFKEQIARGIKSNLENLIQDISLRDQIDTNREVSPLKPADDSIIIDTTHLDYNQVIEKLIEITTKKVSCET
jgi:cytidylate kinase